MSNTAILVDEEDNEIIDNGFIEETKQKTKRKKIIRAPLEKCFNTNSNIIEIGTDEVGRGPLFGRVYSGATVLPRDDTFDHSLMKDSKRFSSTAKINQVADYIRQNAVAWAVCYEDEGTIDSINILQAAQRAMHRAVANVYEQMDAKELIISPDNVLILVDGDYFKTYTNFNKKNGCISRINHHTIKGGDDKFTSIAAASILAKVERDAYISKLCDENPYLSTQYYINSNKGYGSRKHLEAIQTHGITPWHRKTFGICKTFT